MPSRNFLEKSHSPMLSNSYTYFSLVNDFLFMVQLYSSNYCEMNHTLVNLTEILKG